MDVIYRRGQATAAEVMDDIPDLPSYSASRAMLRLLEEKRHLYHTRQGARYIYLPTVSRSEARKAHLKHLLYVFFDDSVEDALADLLEISRKELSADGWSRIDEKIEQARAAGHHSRVS